MRGDSRLDLYAKSLALTGLGLVGAIGALIDYWPGPERFPLVPGASVRRTAPFVQTLVELGGLDVGRSQRLITAAMTSVRPGAPVHGGAPDRPARFFSDKWLEEAVREIGRPVPRPAQRLPVMEVALTSMLPTVILAVDAEATASAGQPSALASRDARLPLVPASASVDRSDDGFLSGMLKKTSSSVSSSLGKASNSLVGAVRVVGGAVKKAF